MTKSIPPDLESSQAPMKRPIPAIKASIPNRKATIRSEPSGKRKRIPPSTIKITPATSDGLQDSVPQDIRNAMQRSELPGRKRVRAGLA
jgi:hypothetical protein